MPLRIQDFPQMPYQLAAGNDDPSARGEWFREIAQWGANTVQTLETRIRDLEVSAQIKASPIVMVQSTATQLTTTGTPTYRAGAGYRIAFALTASHATATATTGCPVWSDPTATAAMWRRFDGTAI